MLLRNESKLAMILLIPAFSVLLLIAFYPLISVFATSLTDRTFASSRETQNVGMANYQKLLSMKILEIPPILEDGEPVIDQETGEIQRMSPLDFLPREPIRYKPLHEFSIFGKPYIIAATDPDFIQSITDTVLFTVLSVGLETILGIAAALILVQAFRGRGFVRMALLIPWAIPTAVSSRMWEWIFTPTRAGAANVITQFFGITDGQFDWLTNSGSQLWAMVAIDVWKTTPFMALLVLAALMMIDKEIYEAAIVDGCNSIRRFWNITLPLIRPTLAVALIFRTLDALRVFDLFQIIFAQKRYSMASYTYYQLIANKQMGYSAAASVIIFIIILMFNFLYIRVSGGITSND
jgi:trehalose/maltose transport system permease protein